MGRHFCCHQMQPSQQLPSKVSLSGWMLFFWETQTHRLHSGVSSNRRPSTCPWTLQALFTVLTSPAKTSKCKQDDLLSSKYGGFVTETSLDGALLQPEQSVRLGKSELQTPKLSFSEPPVGFQNSALFSLGSLLPDQNSLVSHLVLDELRS